MLIGGLALNRRPASADDSDQSRYHRRRRSGTSRSAGFAGLAYGGAMAFVLACSA
jgi:hypothetical protein